MLFPANLFASTEKTKLKNKTQKLGEITTKIYNIPKLTENK